MAHVQVKQRSIWLAVMAGSLAFLATTGGYAAPPIRPPQSVHPAANAVLSEYKVGANDILDIHILRPDELTVRSNVSPGGFISLPYIGTLHVKGKTIAEIQEEVETRLADGYLKYPVVSVVLWESRSRYFFIYGEVETPGAYLLEEDMTVFKALAVAGGLTKFGASSRVKILRPKLQGTGYDTIKINVKQIIDGHQGADAPLQVGDVVVVSEGWL
ncbi:MAG: polysaccharide biosynthesis/export family protein [Candidatus Omnitrophica bacterium]|nr:polysaccharide biosynthesis/export family protein [Candidatus Omnitrophota bacterium]